MPENVWYPRVLVVDPCPFNRNRNTGILKSSLFEGWPKDRLAAVDYSNIQPGFDVCEQYWRLTKTDILRGVVGLSPGAGAIDRPRNLEGSPFDPAEAFRYEARPEIEQRLSFLNGSMRTCIGELVFSLPSVVSGPLRKWISNFRPDLVFSIAGNAAMLRTIARIAAWRKIPLVLFFTDDWMATAYRGQWGGSILRRSMRNLLRVCLDAARVRLTASEAMAAEFSGRYGGVFEPLMQSVEADVVNSFLLPPPARAAVRFTFTGSLAPNRWQPLEAIGKSLMELRAEGIRGELHIYSLPQDLETYGSVFQHVASTVRLVGTAPPGEIPSIQRDADVLVHAEAFDDHTRLYTRLSLSTKIPQYLAAGRCVFAYGPAELASIRYIADSGAGVAESGESPDALRNALRRIVLNPQLREHAGNSAVKVATTRHSATAQRQRFRHVLAEAATSMYERPTYA
jgi:glycosyltransferase involved in cell wall biosynthesis